MINLKMDKYLNIANKAKVQNGLQDYSPLYPVLRVINKKLYIGVLLTSEGENVWEKSAMVKPKYWMLINPEDDSVIEFNETSKKDFVIGNLIEKNIDDNKKEITKFKIIKKMQYKQMLLNDIKQDKLLLVQEKVANVLNNKVNIDGEEVDFNDYLISTVYDEIEDKVNELVDLLVITKYGSIMFYYDILFNDIIDEYNKTGRFDLSKIKICIEIINNYYEGVIGIDNFFNII